MDHGGCALEHYGSNRVVARLQAVQLKDQIMISAKIENGKLIITADIDPEPKPSATGKTLIVASSHGNQVTTAIVKGKPVVIGFNAYIKPA